MGISGKRIHLSVVESTNLYTTELLSHSDIEPWTIVTADDQVGGRGQRGNGWLVEGGKNITLTFAFKPEIALSQQFRISALAMLAILKTLESYGLNAQVKWPNDILINDRKVAGILVENQIQNGFIEWSIVGIGLNVNQLSFPEFSWPATSMVREKKGAQLILEEVQEILISQLPVLWSQILNDTIDFMQLINQHLYRGNQNTSFLSGTEEIEGSIVGVLPDGSLQLRCDDGTYRTFVNGELRLIRSAT